MAKIPDKVVSRLTRYRSLLSEHFPKDKKNIFSHELANLMRLTPSQVRRDLMYTGYTGAPRYGYEVEELVKHISKVLDTGGGQNVALVGMGNLGRALISFLQGRRSFLQIKAAFDSDPQMVNRLFNGVYCHPMDQIDPVISVESIRVAIITVPGVAAQAVAEKLVHAGIKGILNFAPVPLRVPVGVYLEELDMTCSLEKVAYFTTHRAKGERDTQP
jgi:redox-sensing transcriptional repressor